MKTKNMKRNLLWNTLVFALLSIAAAAQDPVQIVLLGGQSNMAGAGNFDALSPADQARVTAVAPRVRISRNGGPAKPLSFLVSPSTLKKRGFSNTFGPELFIGVELAEQHPDQEYLLIKYSQGGTALYGAWNPEWSAEKADAVEKKAFKKTLKLYSLHQAAIAAQLNRLTQEGRPYRIIGMAWMQGENDAAAKISALSYAANLRKLIDGYRTAFQVPHMPFIAGQINSHYGDFPEGPARVRQAFVDVAAADPYVTVIKTTAHAPWSDFPKHEDQVHYNHEGQKRLGTAMANALMELTQ